MKEDYFGPESDPETSLLHEEEPQLSDLPAADTQPRKRQVMGYDLSSVLLAGGAIVMLAAYALWPDNPPATAFIPEEVPRQEPELTFTAVTPFADSAEAEALKAFSATNREAITLLNDRVEKRLMGIEGQLQALAADVTTQPAPKKPASSAPDNSATLRGWQIISLHPGVAWVAFNGSSWAVKKGDVLKGITFLGIDTEQRVVITDKGVIRQGG